LRNFILITGLVLAAIVASTWAAIVILKPGPVGKIVMASGGAGGAYNELALAYKKDLERYGVDLELKPQVEGINTFKGLLPKYRSDFKTYDDANSDIEAGFLKGGFSGSMQGSLANERAHLWRERQQNNLRSLGRLFYEPIWVFYKGAKPLKNLRDLRGKKLYVGSKVSGSRRVVAQLLKANNVDEKNATFIDEDLPEDGAPLLKGEADAALMILPPENARIQKLLHRRDIQLMSFADEAEAYVTRFPALSKVTLRQGGVEFDPDLPAADVTLLATSVALVIRKEMSPSLITLLTYAVMHNPKSGFDKNGDPILFYQPGQFPSSADPEFDLANEARQFYKSGELPMVLKGTAMALDRFDLPFWPAAFANEHGVQTILIAIPVISVLWPLIKFLPLCYTWTMRRRLLYWYRQLKALEHSLDEDPTIEHLEFKRGQLERIDNAVSRLRVPLNMSDQLYDLRSHIDLVRQRLSPRPVMMMAAAQ
jgi:TRAP-type uncharacterized transport system substrate-binding protein